MRKEILGNMATKKQMIEEEIEQLANKLLLEEINKFSNEIASKVSSIHSEFIWNRIFENKITIKEN